MKQIVRTTSIIAILAALITTVSIDAQAGPTIMPAVSSTPVAVGAQTGNAEGVARALLKGKVAGYSGYCEYYTAPQYADNTRIRMQFEMDKTGAITSLQVNGQSIPLDASAGLPIPTNGACYYMNVWANQKTKSGESRAAGSFYTKKFTVGDLLEITLQVAKVVQTIDYEVPDDCPVQNVSVRATDSSQNGLVWGYYDNGKINLYMDPNAGEIGYEVFDGVTGNVLFTGTTSPFESPQISSDAMVNFAYEGNVVEANFGDNGDQGYSSFSGLQFDSPIRIADGTVVMGKVIIADLGGSQLGVSIGAQNGGTTFDNFDIVVKEWKSGNGSLPVVPMSFDENASAWGCVQFLDKVIIEVVPRKDSVPSDFRFNVTVTKWYPTGGKG